MSNFLNQFSFSTLLLLNIILGFSNGAFAQSSPESQSTSPASIENSGGGVQINNGNSNFNGTLTTPTCTYSVCGFGLIRATPQGAEAILGTIFNLGASSENDSEVDKLRVEMEKSKNDNDRHLKLLEYFGQAVDSGIKARIRAVAISLAPLEGYKDFREYLKAVLSDN